jgi:undecaprenyl-phosphate 4-deoxy-4-formamido-L-arabinose transferase
MNHLKHAPGIRAPRRYRSSSPSTTRKTAWTRCSRGSTRRSTQLGTSYEVIFVNDGSRDRSAAMLAEQFRVRPDVTRVVLFNGNYGQHMAILAGFEQSRGDIVITLDADLQNPPEEIGKLVAKMREGYDYVGSIRRSARTAVAAQCVAGHEPPARAHHRIKMTDQGCMLRAYGRNIIDTINQCGEVNTFIPALAYTFARTRPKSRSRTRSARGRIEILAVQPDPPELRPGHRLLGRAAAVALVHRHDAVARSAALFVLLLVRRFIVGAEVQGVFTLFAITFFLLGVILFGIGLLGEYIGRIYQQVRARPRYLVQAVLEQHDGVPAVPAAADRTGAAR